MHLVVKAKGEETQKSVLSILHFFSNWSTNKTITQFSVTCFCNQEFDLLISFQEWQLRIIILKIFKFWDSSITSTDKKITEIM